LANLSVGEQVPGYDEFAVVEAAKRGESEALSQLYEHYSPRVYRFVNARLSSIEDAEDVTTEIFLKIIDGIGSFTWRGIPFGAWVFRIARNEVVSHVRRQKSRASTTELTESTPAMIPDHSAAVEQQLTFEMVRKAIDRLPEAQRQVVSLRFLAGLSVAETASALSKTENNVKVLQHKAIAKLQVLVGRQ
jgi:RNA polymerase sigma-70 factor (ECF subfamily)